MSDHRIIASGELRFYQHEQDGELSWIVSGKSKKTNKRWRRRFASVEAARAFMATAASASGVAKEGRGERRETIVNGCDGRGVNAEGESSPRAPVVRGPLRSSKRSRRLRHAAITLAVATLTFVAVSGLLFDKRQRSVALRAERESAFSCDFQSNPMLSLWECGDDSGGSPWVVDRLGNGAISLSHGEWLSPPIYLSGLPWGRVRFRSLVREGSIVNDNVQGSCCRVLLYSDSGTVVSDVTRFRITGPQRWRQNEFIFRARSVLGVRETGGASSLKLAFENRDGSEVLVDDVSIEWMDSLGLLKWMEASSSVLPQDLYVNKGAERWSHLRETIRRLKNRQSLKIVLADAGGNGGMMNLPIEALLTRLYPGARPEVVCSVPLSGHGETARERAKGITAERPNLIVVAGGPTEVGGENLVELVREARLMKDVTGAQPEILLLSHSLGSADSVSDPEAFRSTMTELRAGEVEVNGIFSDYRTRLINFAETNGLAFLDTAGVFSQFLFGKESAIKLGPVGVSDRVPDTYRATDWVQSHLVRELVLARIIGGYFSPKEAQGEADKVQLERGSLVKRFDPDRNSADLTAYQSARGVFGVGAAERPGLAVDLTSNNAGQPLRRALGAGAQFRNNEWVARVEAYELDEALDVKNEEIAFYWSFYSGRTAVGNSKEITASLCFAGPNKESANDSVRIALTLISDGPSRFEVLGIQKGRDELENLVESSAENTTDPSALERCRIVVRWAGADRIVAEASRWNVRRKRWEAFTPHGRPGASAVVLELSITEHLHGQTLLSSVLFEGPAGDLGVQHVLLTGRPSAVR